MLVLMGGAPARALIIPCNKCVVIARVRLLYGKQKCSALVLFLPACAGWKQPPSREGEEERKGKRFVYNERRKSDGRHEGEKLEQRSSLSKSDGWSLSCLRLNSINIITRTPSTSGSKRCNSSHSRTLHGEKWPSKGMPHEGQEKLFNMIY